MNIKVLFLLFSMLLIMLACGKKNEKEQVDEIENKEKTSGRVTVVLSPNEQSFYSIPSLRFFNGYYVEHLIGVTDTTKTQTFILDFFMPEGEITYFHNEGYTYSYVVHLDDTLYLDLKTYSYPRATVRGVKQLLHDLNWFAFFNEEKLQDSFYNEFNLYKKYGRKEIKEFISGYLPLYSEKKNYVDSLRRNDLISEDRLLMIYKELDIDSTYLATYINEDNLDFFDDDYLPYHSYISYMKSFASDYSKPSYDPRVIFDRLLLDARIPERTKLCFLFDNLREIGEANAREDFKSRAEQFLTHVNHDSIWIDFIRDISPMSTIDSKNMQLYDQDMQQVDFNELMRTLEGNVVYIDVWASWCVPCKAAMPLAEKIRDQYKDKPVVFLYLAFSDKEKPWKEDVHRFSLNGQNAKSYMIASPESDWVNNMQINTIPRYILYDKKGELISRNAPSPEDSKLFELLDSLL